jgi:hypothetical protein
MLGSETETAATLDQLIIRLGADPASSTVDQMSHLAAKRFLAEHAPGAEQQIGVSEPSRPSVMLIKSEFFRRPLPGNTSGALADAFVAGREAGQVRELDFTPWGAAYNRIQPDATKPIPSSPPRNLDAESASHTGAGDAPSRHRSHLPRRERRRRGAIGRRPLARGSGAADCTTHPRATAHDRPNADLSVRLARVRPPFARDPISLRDRR